MRSRLAPTLTALVAATLLLTGCSVLAPDYEHVDPTKVPSEHTEAGAGLKLSEVALIGSTDPVVDIAISVRLVEERDASLFDALDNGDEFAEYTPVVVVVQYDTIGELGDDKPSFNDLGGMLGNGEFAGALIEDTVGGVSGGVCPYSLSSTNGGDGSWSLVCMVYLVPEGETLETIGYYGFDPYSSFGAGYIDPAQADYEETPILWKLSL